MGFSVATGTAILEGLVNGVAIPLPPGFHIGLSTGTPTGDDGTGVVEPPVANGYARLSEQGNFTLGAGTRIAVNDNNLLWGQATTLDWGLISHVVFYETTGVGGIYRGNYALVTPRQIDVGDSLQIDAGSLSINFQQV